MSILVVGDLMLDIYEHVDIYRVSPEAPCLIGLNKFNTYFLGGAANVAHNLFKLTSEFQLVGKCSIFENTQFMRLIRDVGIPVNFLNGNISTKIRFVDTRSKTQVFRHDIETPLDDNYQKDFLDINELFSKLPNYPRVLLLVDYRKGMIRPNSVKFMRSSAINIVSSKSTRPSELLPTKGSENRVNILVLNQHEFKRLKEYKEYDYIVRTEGSDGISIIKREKMEPLYHIPAFPVAVFDVTGAGDTVVAILAFCLHKFGFTEENLKKACYIANREAAQCVAHHGTTVTECTSNTISSFWAALDSDGLL